MTRPAPTEIARRRLDLQADPLDVLRRFRGRDRLVALIGAWHHGEALIAFDPVEVLGVTWRIEAIVDPGARPGVPDDHDDDHGRPAAPAPSAPARSGPPVAVPDSVRAAMSEQHSPATREDPDASADRDDPVVEVEELDAEALLSRELGAEVIDTPRGD